jgi:ABC-2 type transport system permease protein
MDAGLDTFSLTIPSGFQRDVLAGRNPVMQLNVDATRMGQAFTGSGYIQVIVGDEVSTFLQGYRSNTIPTVDLALRARFNPELNQSWFGAIMQVIDSVTMWSMALVVLAATAFSLIFVVQGLLSVPIEGSIGLFLFGTTLHLFATASLGIFLGTIARSMPQFGLLMMLVLLPLQMLSGAMTPRESMPQFIQLLMQAAPNTHFVILAQAILYRGAGLSVVWPQFIALVLIGIALFSLSLARFRKTIGTMI